MIVYRISRERFCKDISGTGARLYGGRWNPKGMSMFYTADSKALAAMELAVRMDLNDLPTDLVMMSLQLPVGGNSSDAPIAVLGTLPENWDAHPHTTATQQVGKYFVEEGKYLALKVPSATVRGDYNYLLNPMHAASHLVKVQSIEPFFLGEKLGRHA